MDVMEIPGTQTLSDRRAPMFVWVGMLLGLLLGATVVVSVGLRMRGSASAASVKPGSPPRRGSKMPTPYSRSRATSRTVMPSTGVAITCSSDVA